MLHANMHRFTIQGTVEYCKNSPLHHLRESTKLTRENSGVFKKARPARPQPLGRAERTEEYVSTAKGRERRWRHFSTLPFKVLTNQIHP